MLNQDDSTETIKLVTVGGEQVQNGRLSNELALVGSTSAADVVSIIPTMVGVVETVEVSIGDYVLEGDVLFTMDPEAVESQVTQAESAVTMAEIGVKNASAAVAQAQIGYEMAKANYDVSVKNYEFGKANLDKYEQMYEQGLVSETEIEQMRLQTSDENLVLIEQQFEQTKSSIAQANLGLESAQTQLTQAKDGYETASDLLFDMTVTAPISGYITSMTVSEENYASNAAAAIVIANVDEIIVSASVTESLVNNLHKGDSVNVMMDSLDGLVVDGMIDTLGASVDRTLLYPLTVRVNNDDHQIKPGMFATVILETEVSENALFVPAEAVLLRDGQYFVYIFDNDQHANKVQVEVGIDTGNFIEITEGVSADDIVITKGLGLIDESTAIKVLRSDE